MEPEERPVIFEESIQRMRRFLRDPSGQIWTDNDLVNYFNDSSTEISQKSKLLEKVNVLKYPPIYTWAYMRDWEHSETAGDQYQALAIDQLSGNVITYPWEAAYWMSGSPTADDGYRFTMPFEGVQSGSPAEPIEIELDSAFTRMSFASFDQWIIEPITRREVINNDRFYKTRTGSRVLNYYRPDEYGYKMVLYPSPGGVTWQDDSDASGLSDTGGFISDPAIFSNADTGLPIEVIDLAGALFVVYEAIPYMIEAASDKIPWPGWFVRYVEYGALERAYGADTDGHIPSLRDFWQKRKEIGLKVLEKFQRLQASDQDYRMGGPPRIPHSRGGSLPSGYPPVYR